MEDFAARSLIYNRRGLRIQVDISKLGTVVSKFWNDVPKSGCSLTILLDGTRDLGIGIKFCCSLVDLFNGGRESRLGVGFTEFGSS